MSYFDLIIKYLSGDLSQDEATSFKKELESNDELKKAFEEQAAAFRLIRDQLQKRDEEEFRRKLQKAMRPGNPLLVPRKKQGGKRWLIPLAAAGILIITILVMQFNKHGDQQVFSRYYQPERDPVLLAFNQETRGESEPGILYYRSGNYTRSLELLSPQMVEDTGNRQVMLYCLLSAIELNRQDEIMGLVRLENQDSLDIPDQAIAWYSALALLKSEQKEAALEKIHPLTQQPGPYHSDAIKLEKELLK